MPRKDGLPLSGVRVLDVSRVLAGPLCTQSLADLGADVIKLETPDGGDETRNWPPLRQPGMGAVFMAMNRNKRSIAVDLKRPEGVSIVHRIAKVCDVFVENYSTGVADRLGIGAEAMQEFNPALIYCSISGYGRTGPMKQSAGYDVILQAFSGIMSLTGEPGGNPLRIPISPIDYSTGQNAFSGILASLIERGVTGRGGKVEVSLLESALSLLGYSFQSYWEKGVQPAKWGSSHEGLCPYQAFQAADGPVMIGVANDGLWKKFCAIADLNDIVSDPKFKTNADRVAHRAELLAIVEARVAERNVDFWVETLTAVSVPVAPVNDLAQALNNEQTQARQIILDYEFGDGRTARTIGLPITLNHRARTIDRRPPDLGEHTNEVLAEFGYSATEIEQLNLAKVIGKVGQ